MVGREVVIAVRVVVVVVVEQAYLLLEALLLKVLQLVLSVTALLARMEQEMVAEAEVVQRRLGIKVQVQ